MSVACVSRSLVVAIALAAVAAAHAQTFEVASVRPNKDGSQDGRGGGIRPLATGHFTATNVTLEELLRRAYGLHESQLIGGPRWMTTERFDIVAKAAEPPARGVEGVLLMLRALLVERFKLDARTEQRERPAYVLMHAKPQPQLGAGLRVSRVDCAANAVPVTPNTAPVDAEGWPPCGLALVRSMVITAAEGTRTRTAMKQAGVPITEIATRMQNLAGRPVVDGTGLAGLFDVQYEFDGSTGTAPPAPPGDVAEVGDLFTAVREQLGLKLEARRTLVDVLVVASADRPSEN